MDTPPPSNSDTLEDVATPDPAAAPDPAAHARRSPKAIAQLLESRPGTRVLDVRTAASRGASSTIEGSELLDVNAELAEGELAVLLDANLPVDEPIVFVCNSGGKCSLAAAYLRDRGYDAMSIDGGMYAWEAAGNPVRQPVDNDA